MDKIVLDFRYQERGCASSGLVAYGVRDPEGDRFKLAVRIVDTIAQENEAIFVKVGAEYGRIDGVYTEDRLMVWFPGWNRDIPPYPFGLQCDPISQPEPIMPSINIIPLVLMVEARDERGAVSKFELPMRRMGNPCRGR